MLGAIIGDIAGSRFEFNPTNDLNFEIFHHDSDYTDDSICTIAIADAILRGRDYGDALLDWCNRAQYRNPMGAYGGMFARWLRSNDPKPYGSYGNGSAMRVSPVAYAFRREEECLRQAALTAVPTHNHPEGIKGAQATALAMHLVLNDEHAKDRVRTIMATVAERFDYDIDLRNEDVENSFDVTCQGTVPVALWIIKQSTSFEDAVRRAVSLGADADTLGAIVGGIAETIWGIPVWMENKAYSFLPQDAHEVVQQFYKTFILKTTIQ